MNKYNRYLADLFAGRHFYFGIAICSGLFLLTFFSPALQALAFFAFVIFVVLLMTDYAVLFFTRYSFRVTRTLPQRFSNGDINKISWDIKNEFRFGISVLLIDEWPFQFQLRKQKWRLSIPGRGQKKISWELRPVNRGEYAFGNIHLFVSTPLRMVVRRFTTPAEEVVSCYPSFVRLKHYRLLSNATLDNESGNNRMRKIGQSLEFEQIKEYVTGDDIRTVNWKASARRGMLMINQYMQERAQQVYCIIDKGRLMKMPFDGMSLLDYAVNASLILSSVCLENKDKTGLISFSNKIDTMLAATNRPLQMNSIIKSLYKEETDFLESDFELLYHTVRSRIRNRSLLILFTNFESVSGLYRQMDYIRSLAKYHLLLVVFFENSELKQLIKKSADTVEKVYVKTIAEKFNFEKKLIARELGNYGVTTILTKPADLTIKTINKYLELKIKSAL